MKQSKKENIIGSVWSFDYDYVSHVVHVEEAFTSDECEKIIKYGNSFKNKKGIVLSDEQDVRKSNISWLGLCDESRWIFERLANIIKDFNNQYFKFDLFGITEALQFTHYKHPDGKYQAHLDKIFGGTVRKLSAVVQLSDPKKYKGGDLLLHQGPKPMIVNKSQGYVTLFPSYTLHEVRPVTKGERYSLVCWVSGKPFR
tara:strand:+ start:1722 stop:2318 length:597 start_codon:yes stop_codon:yes gene_type:complete